MAVDLVAIHQAVCDTIGASLPSVRCYPSYRDSLQPPCIVVVGDPSSYVTFDQAMHGGITFVRVLLLMLGPVSDRAGQEQIMRWLSAGAGGESIPDALQAGGTVDRSLGGTVQSFRFTGSRYASALEYPPGSSTRYAAGELDLELVV